MANDSTSRWLLPIVITVMLVCAGGSWAAQLSTTGIRRDLDVHAAGQGQRIANIEKATARNEAALRRIEELLRNR